MGKSIALIVDLETSIFFPLQMEKYDKVTPPLLVNEVKISALKPKKSNCKLVLGGIGLFIIALTFGKMRR